MWGGKHKVDTYGTVEYLGKLSFDDVKHVAKGSYQRGLLAGDNNWSGSDLKGNAKKYSSRYAASRMSLIYALKAAGFCVWEAKGNSRQNVLVISKKRGHCPALPGL